MLHVKVNENNADGSALALGNNYLSSGRAFLPIAAQQPPTIINKANHIAVVKMVGKFIAKCLESGTLLSSVAYQSRLSVFRSQ